MTRLDAARGQAQARRLEEQAQVEVVRRINVLVKRDPARFVDLWYTHHSANEVAGGRRITMRDGSTVPAGVLRNASMGTRAGHPDLVNYAPRTFRGRLREESAARVSRALAELPIQARRAVFLYYIKGWQITSDDSAKTTISSALKVSEKTVRNYLRHGEELLRAWYAKERTDGRA